MSIGAAINDLVSSFYELFASVLGGIYNTIHALLAAVIGLFSGFINLIGDVFKGAVDVVGGLGKFLASKFACAPAFPQFPFKFPGFLLASPPTTVSLYADSHCPTGNIVIVAIIAAGGYAFVRYNQGRPIAPAAQKKVQ